MKRFTLIELMMVIVVIGILAVIVVPNIKDTKNEAEYTSMLVNLNNIQTSVDMYRIKTNGDLPSINPPKEFIPQPIDFSKIVPTELRNKPKLEDVYYWVDVRGKVWSARVDSPSNVRVENGELTWDEVDDASYYEVFEVMNSKNNVTSAIQSYSNLKTMGVVEESNFPVLSGRSYVVVAYDINDFPSAPSGEGYSGYEDYLKSKIDTTAPSKVITKSEFIIDAGALSTWNSMTIQDIKPTGTSIKYTYSTSSDQLTWSNTVEDVSELPTGIFLKVFIEMEKEPNALGEPKVLSISANYTKNGTVISTPVITKYNTKIDFSKYSNIIYVDSQKGLDSNNGTQESPLQSVNKAYSIAQNGDLLYFNNGTYTLSNMTTMSKDVDFYGQNKDTVFIFNTTYHRPFSEGNGYLGVTSNVSFYNMIIETKGAGTNANYFYNKGNMAFYNTVFRNFYDLSFTDFLNYENSHMYFYNVTIDPTASKNLFVRQIYPNATLVFQNVYGNLTLDNRYSSVRIDPSVLKDSMIVTTPQLDSSYNILQEGWENAGLGNNPDGTKSNIGIYGGPNAWK